MIFRLGEIRSVNEADNIVKVKDLYNNSLYDIPLDNHVHFQAMPVVGDICLFLNYDDKIQKIVKIWEIKVDQLKRQKAFLLKEGELQVQGIYGQYIYFDNNGKIKFVDSTMANEFELNMEGFIARLKKWQFTTYDGTQVTVDKDIIIKRGDNIGTDDEELNFSATINDDGIAIVNKESEITVTPEGEIVIKAAKSIKLGNQLYGGCQTSGQFGTHPICFVTGAPIQGSTKVEIEG